MSQRTTPFSIEKIPPNREKEILRQTGKRVLHMNILRMATHRHTPSGSEAPTYLTELMEMVSAVTGYGNYSDLKQANPSTWAHNKDTDWDEFPLWLYITRLAAQSETYMLGWSKMVDMYVTKASVIDASTSAEIWYFYDEMFNALSGLPPTLNIDAGTAPTSLAAALEALDWRFNGNTKDAHRDWVMRFVIMIGYLFKPLLPRFNEKFEDMDDKQIQRVVMTFLCAAIEILYDLIILGAAQSERAMANVTFLDKNRLSMKVPEDFRSAIDAFWIEAVCKKFTETVPAGHTMYTTEFVDTALVNNVTTLDDYIKDALLQYPVCDYALKWARQMFGIGKCTRLEEEVHFANLLDITGGINIVAANPDDWKDVKNTNSKWYIFANLPIIILCLQDRRNRKSIWTKALKNRRHWTYSDVDGFVEKLFVDFSLAKSLEGRAEDASYAGLRAELNFEADSYAVPLVSSNFSDPSKMVSTNDLAMDALDSTLANRPTAFWIYPFIMQLKYTNPQFNIWVLNEWTEQELWFWVRWGMFLSRVPESTPIYGLYDYSRIWGVTHRYVEYIDARTLEFVCLMSSTSEEPRFESYENVHEFDSTAVKYGCTCVKVEPTTLDIVDSAPRLHGLMNHNSMLIKGLAFDVDNCQNFLARCWGNPSKAEGKTVKADIPESKPDVPPTEVKPDDKDDE